LPEGNPVSGRSQRLVSVACNSGWPKLGEIQGSVLHSQKEGRKVTGNVDIILEFSKLNVMF
jgi:hypothetical protein